MQKMDYYVIYETKQGIRKDMFGYTKNPALALSELQRLYQIDPFQTKGRFSLEITNFAPQYGRIMDVKQ